MVERILNFVSNRDSQLLNALDRSKNNPLIRKYSIYHLLTDKCMYQSLQMIIIRLSQIMVLSNSLIVQILKTKILILFSNIYFYQYQAVYHYFL